MSSTSSLEEDGGKQHTDDNNSSSSSNSDSVNIKLDSTSSGILFCWGSGDLGQHGQGHTSDVSFLWSEVKQLGESPGNVQGRGDRIVVASASCGANHSVIVTDSGEVYAWGDGRYGQLGCGGEQTKPQPTLASLPIMQQIPPSHDFPRIRTAACGRHHTLLLSDEGRVFACGRNDSSQLGLDNDIKDAKRAKDQLRPCLLEALASRPVLEVSCGHRHSLFLFHDGTVAAVGNNSHGQLGDGSRVDSRVPKTVAVGSSKGGEGGRIVRVSSGAKHNLAISESGSVFCWGFGKACGKRHGDVMTPTKMALKGRQAVQAAGGTTHSLVLTAGGKVFSWGVGKHGQLGLGSVVISSRPRQLRHSCLQEGASSVACGDAYSAVITASGRLCMWGRNGRLIEEWREPRDTIRDPQCLNPEPLAPVRHVSCGLRHAVALGGLPDFVHASESDAEEDDDDGDDDDEVTTSDSEDESDDTLSSFSGDGEQGEFVSGTNTCSDDLSFRDPEPSFLAYKGPWSSGKMTKLTIGEFYCLTPDLDTPPPSTLETDTPCMAPPPPSLSSSINPPPPPSPHTPILPSIPNNPSSTHTINPETFHPSQGNCLRPLKGQAIATIQNVDLSTLLLPKDAAAAVVRRPPNSAYSTRSKPRSGAALSFLSSAGRERRRLPLQRDAQELPPEKLGNDACEDTDNEDDLRETEEVQQQTSVNLVSGTNAVTPSKRRVQVGRSPFKTLPVIMGSGGEKCAIVSKNVDILDIHQLLVGGGGGGGGGGIVSGCSPQNSYVAQSPSLAHLGGLDRPGGFGGFKYLLDDDELLNNWGGQVPSPECCEGDDVPPSSVPTHQIEGDFSGDKTKNKTKKSSSTSSSPSAKLFGGLPGHLSRRPVKFFKRPAPIGHLSKTTTTTATTTQHSSQLPPLSASTLAQFFQPSSLCYSSGDSRKSEGLSRSGNVRSLGAVGMPSTAGDQELLGYFPGSSSRQQFIIQTPSSPAEAPNFQTTSTKISLIGTLEAEGSSWQDRLPLPGLAAAQDEKKTQSAPSRRKKRVSFADECTNNRSSSVLGNHHPRLPKSTPTTTTLTAAFAAVSRRPDTTPNFLTGNSKKGSHPEEGKPRASKNLDRQDSSQYRFVPAAFENHNFFRGSRPGHSQRPVPTLAYQRPGSKRQGNKSGPAGPRSGTLRTLMSTGPGPPRCSALKAGGEGRSGSGMVVAGSQGRQTRRAHFE